MKKLWAVSVTVMVVALTVLVVASSLDGENQQSTGEVSLEEDKIVLKTSPISRLGSHEHGSFGHHMTKSTTFTVPRDMWVTGYEVSMVNAPNATLHHGTLWAQNNQQDVPGGWPPGLMASWGRDNFNSYFWNEPYGIFVPEGTVLRLEGMFHNSKPPYGPGGTYENVSFKVEIGTELGTNARDKSLEYYLLQLNDEPGGMSIFTVPAGEGTYTRTPESNIGWHEFSQSGRIVGMGAHLHGWEGGQNVSLYLNQELLRSFEPENVSSDPWNWETGQTRTDIPVEEGDVINIRAAYEKQNKPMKGAMGMSGFFFAPDE